MPKMKVKFANKGSWYSKEYKRVYKNTPVFVRFVDEKPEMYVMNGDGTTTIVEQTTEILVCDEFYNVLDIVYETPANEGEETLTTSIIKKTIPSETHKGNTIKNDFRVFNTEKLREMLSTKIYVSGLGGFYYYNVNTQELIGDVDEFLTKSYYLKQQDGQFYLEGKPGYSKNAVQVFKQADYQDVGIIEETGVFTPLNVEYITDEKFDVDFTKCLIYKDVGGQMELVSNCIIFPEWALDKPFMITDNIIMGLPEVVYVQEIENPIIYDSSLNPHIKFDKDIVLPYITEDDLVDGLYFQMFDIDNEILPEWKRDTPKNWEVNTVYEENDVIIYNGKYYVVKKRFTTDDLFSTNNLRGPISDNELEEYLPRKYFPTLDLAYCEYGQNRSALTELNIKEKSGEFWFGKKFAFYEIIFEPIFNKSIDSFGIKFYNSTYKNSPEFWLMY